MNSFDDVFDLLSKLDRTLIELSIVLRSRYYQEMFADRFSILIKNILSIIETLEILLTTKDFSKFTQDDADYLNESFKNIVDDISILMASFNKKKASKEEISQYEILLKNLSVLEKIKYEVEKCSGFHIMKISASLSKGKKLMIENVKSFLKDFTTINELL